MYNSHITSSCGRRKRYAAGHWREIHMKTMKKLWLMVAALSVTTLLCVISASACTMVYVGSDYTADGSTFMARSEDYSNSYNKIAYVSQHGKHAAGSVYEAATALPTPSPTTATPTPPSPTTTPPASAPTATVPTPTPPWRSAARMKRVSPSPPWLR